MRIRIRLIVFVAIVLMMCEKSLGQNAVSKNNILPIDEVTRNGYAFIDSTGSEIAFLSNAELYQKNPYGKTSLVPQKRATGEEYQSFYVGDLSVTEIKNGLPENLERTPSDSLLKTIGMITASVSMIDYDPRYRNYLIVEYSLEMYDKSNMTERWVETTMHVYNADGKIISSIEDKHNIQGAFITPDGKYMLGNEIRSSMGDGTSEMYLGPVVYDVQKSEFIGRLRWKNGQYYNTDVKNSTYEDGYLLLYANLYKDRLQSENFTLVKLIIDPERKRLYQKNVDNPASTQCSFQLKSHLHPQGEDISTYDEGSF